MNGFFKGLSVDTLFAKSALTKHMQRSAAKAFFEGRSVDHLFADSALTKNMQRGSAPEAFKCMYF